MWKRGYPNFCFLIIILSFIIGAINPVFPADWLTESILVIVTFPLLLIFHFKYKKFKFSNASFTLITLFYISHIIGSHYTYSETPIGFWIQDLFNFSRNHYDRIVHFLWGTLLYLPALEITKHFTKINNTSKNFFFYLIPSFILISFGAIFEALEWIAGIVLEPEVGIAYLGIQGDVWDTQKDIALKAIASLISSIFFYIKKK